MIKLLAILSLCSSIVCLPDPLGAGPITYEFSGSVTDTGGDHLEYQLPELTIGDTFSGFFTDDGVSTMMLSVTVGDYTFSRDNGVHTWTDDAGLNAISELFFVQGAASGFRAEYLKVLGLYDGGTISFYGESILESVTDNPSGYVYWSGTITVPEPSTLVLFALGAAAALTRRQFANVCG